MCVHGYALPSLTISGVILTQSGVQVYTEGAGKDKAAGGRKQSRVSLAQAASISREGIKQKRGVATGAHKFRVNSCHSVRAESTDTKRRRTELSREIIMKEVS
jgi:hypothetical protein